MESDNQGKNQRALPKIDDLLSPGELDSCEGLHNVIRDELLARIYELAISGKKINLEDPSLHVLNLWMESAAERPGLLVDYLQKLYAITSTKACSLTIALGESHQLITTLRIYSKLLFRLLEVVEKRLEETPIKRYRTDLKESALDLFFWDGTVGEA